MSDRFDIKAGERGVVRLFRIDLPSDQVKAFSNLDRMTGRWPLKEALGIEDINDTFIDVFSVEDLGEMGLAGYMNDGLGISQDELAADGTLLNSVQGCVLVMLSGAFKGLAVTLLPSAPLRWIGTYKEDRAPVQFEKLPDQGAETAVPDVPAKKKPSDAAMSGKVAMLALLVFFGLTALMIWIAA
ncbi:MAG: hypothetical protein AAGF53_11085 [Pseudomonadota bacterium]